MKDKKLILKRIALKSFRKKIKRKKKKLLLYKNKLYSLEFLRSKLKRNYTYDNLLNVLLSKSLLHILHDQKSYFNVNNLYKTALRIKSSIMMVPKEFSIIDNPIESYAFIRKVFACLIFQPFPAIRVDYGECKSVDLTAQVMLDIIQKDMIHFFKLCGKIKKAKQHMKSVSGYVGNNQRDIKKMLFSVGSPAILTNNSIVFNDIVPYRLCIHDRQGAGNMLKIMEKKELDTTRLVDYVINSLKRLKKTLPSDKIDDLCTVIGEILINAEEHSTTGTRFSIGYFQEIDHNGRHCGMFRLVILNFGKTIYEKFKDPYCGNKTIVDKMRRLSRAYTGQGYFTKKSFEEETLWTLYALQEGVTSVDPEKFRKRGHGSIQFIESFFNMKGKHHEADTVSRMTILSGNTSISFDGTYSIVEDETEQERFKRMTFNESGKYDDKPDSNFVKFVSSYFPGTVISAKILFNEDDVEVLN